MTAVGAHVEQLHYTWAERGREGLSRFQVTASSPGLHDLDSPLARLAVRLCRYDGEVSASSAPPSSGWIDAREHRFVFHRRPVGADALGRPGNFIAHVLMLPAGLLSSWESLALIRCWPWWSGQPCDDDLLPSVDIERLRSQTDAVVVPPADVQLVAHLLARGLRGAVHAAPDDLWAACAHLLQAVPVDPVHMPSFSTYEASDALGWFRLAGTGRLGNWSPSGTERAAAEVVLDTSPRGRRRRRALVQAVSRDGAPRWQDYCVLAAALAHAAEEDPHLGQLLPALARPSVADELLQVPAVQAVVALALSRGDVTVRQALTAGAAGVSPAVLERLGAATGKLCPPARVPALVDLVASLPTALLRGLAQTLAPHAATGKLDDWHPRVLVAALLEGCWNQHALDRARLALAPRARELAVDAGLSVAERCRLVLLALGHRQVRPRELAAALVGDVELSDAVVPCLNSDEVLDLLEGAPAPDALALLRRHRATLAPEVLTQALRTVSIDLPTDAAVSVTLEVARCKGTTSTSAWPSLIDGLVVRLLTSDLQQGSTHHALILDELAQTARRRLYWGQFFEHLRRTARGQRGMLEAAAGALAILPASHRELAGRYAALRGAPLLRSWAELDFFLMRAGGWHDEVLLWELLRGVTPRHPGKDIPQPAASLILQYVVLQSAWTPKLQAVAGRLCRHLGERDWHDLCEALDGQGRLARGRLKALRAFRLEELHKSSRRWLPRR